MVYGLVLMLLALYRAAEYWKMSSGFRGFKLVKVLIRDQIIYFLLAIMCCVFNILNFKVPVNNDVLEMFLQQAGNPSFLCILGSRLLFNLKEAGKLGVNEGTNYRTTSMSTIEFDQPARSEGRFIFLFLTSYELNVEIGASTSDAGAITEDSGSTRFVPQDSSV
ncbi:uncharacterized protein FOMMEDRAFT_160599 [Fomitiporia mediterranea MF3/22]|uniref:uncharacterized protein n=1 Tax=Fomitiporia mediterranea (strain MF3/22) TaxID=694068 RepID=UPI0004408EBB|nr:uncharacterized protein FOMMEDRAFT_160599 [Fomitiporia mediterranea MF3/22]EJC99532.1 hypothetical protein FOMMEDRAFT_160599 [Fomitiporia mediterranea MF3/22]